AGDLPASVRDHRAVVVSADERAGFFPAAGDGSAVGGAGAAAGATRRGPARRRAGYPLEYLLPPLRAAGAVRAAAPAARRLRAAVPRRGRVLRQRRGHALPVAVGGVVDPLRSGRAAGGEELAAAPEPVRAPQDRHLPERPD